MDVDAKTIVETFQAIAALFTCIGAGIEMFKKKEPQKETVKADVVKTEGAQKEEKLSKAKEPQKVVCERKVLPRELCYSR